MWKVSTGSVVAVVQPLSQPRLTLCDPTDCSAPGFPVRQHLPEFARIPVHRAGDAI